MTCFLVSTFNCGPNTKQWNSSGSRGKPFGLVSFQNRQGLWDPEIEGAQMRIQDFWGFSQPLGEGTFHAISVLFLFSFFSDCWQIAWDNLVKQLMMDAATEKALLLVEKQNAVDSTGLLKSKLQQVKVMQVTRRLLKTNPWWSWDLVWDDSFQK